VLCIVIVDLDAVISLFDISVLVVGNSFYGLLGDIDGIGTILIVEIVSVVIRDEVAHCLTSVLYCGDYLCNPVTVAVYILPITLTVTVLINTALRCDHSLASLTVSALLGTFLAVILRNFVTTFRYVRDCRVYHCRRRFTLPQRYSVAFDSPSFRRYSSSWR